MCREEVTHEEPRKAVLEGWRHRKEGEGVGKAESGCG